ncbi:MAG: VanZ family protein [Bacillaceae bacterium]|nr:VanZ family protein [Bacillaceae bacterium]
MKYRHFVSYILPPLLWASIIFYASSQPYEQQDLRPMLGEMFDWTFVEAYFSSISFSYGGSEVSISERGTAGFVEFFIRKGAHVFVYFTLGFLIYRLLNQYIKRIDQRIGLSFFIVVFYAAFDEIHQFFRPNRTGLIDDVVLDSIGGLLGIMIGFLFYRLKSRRWL